MEIIAFIAIVIVVGFLIIPTKKNPVYAHAARPEGCTCPEYSRWSITIDYDCPVHGDWEDPLYPVEAIKVANMSEREKACHDAGLYVNKLLREKSEKK